MYQALATAVLLAATVSPLCLEGQMRTMNAQALRGELALARLFVLRSLIQMDSV